MAVRKRVLLIGDTKITLRFTSFKPSRVLFLNLHENEQTSVEAVRTLLPNWGGTLVEVLHGGDRHIAFQWRKKSYQIDPNRIFTKMGTLLTLVGLNNLAPSQALQHVVNDFAKVLLQTIREESRFDRIVGLHNNTDDDVPGGGHFSARNYLPGADMVAAAQAITLNYLEDQDDFLYCTTPEIFRAAVIQGYNAVLQAAVDCPDDGSMSVYCANHGIPYVNSECQYDHGAKQTEMLTFILDRWS